MNNSTQDTEWIIRYIDNELAAEEKIAVENRLQTDEQFKTEFNNLLSAREAIKLFGLKNQVASIRSSMNADKKGRVKKMTVGRMIRISVGVAAAVIFTFVAIEGYFFYKLSPESLYNEQYARYELSNVRSVTLRSDLEQAYADRNFSGVTQMHREKRNFSDQERLLIGISYMEQNNPGKAIELFRQITQNKALFAEPLFEDAEYYLALAYLKNRDFDLAIPLMNKIHADTDHPYNEKFTKRFIRRVKLLKWR